jgi:uncharacterized protein YndB with AHSA1/START domain
MSTIRHEVWINADTKTVFDALTTQPGLDSWWGKALSAEPKVGHVIEFDHGHGDLLRMRITDLEPNERVVWRCVSDFTDPGYPGSEWLGHELHFELASAGDDPLAQRLLGILFDTDSRDPVTILRLEQRGWSSDDRWSAFCNSAWGATLAGPLKSYCEGPNGRTGP